MYSCFGDFILIIIFVFITVKSNEIGTVYKRNTMVIPSILYILCHLLTTKLSPTYNSQEIRIRLVLKF